MRIARAETTDADKVGTMRDGVLAQKHLLFGKDGTPTNYDLNMGRAGAGGWRTPRHRHNFDQIRYVIKGQLPYGENLMLPEGWIAYFPESVPYGPQDRAEGLETMVLQFGGASGFGYLSVAGREAANAALNKKGHFKGGLFHYTDENGQQQSRDGSEACFEEATGQPLVFAPPRYSDVIAMNPDAYDWIEGEKGCYTKTLGTFTEKGARIGFVKLDAEGVYHGGGKESFEILFQTKGKVVVDNEVIGRHSAFEFLPNESPVPLRAVEPTELISMVLHKF
ncbi:MAG: hypothetical protein O9333_06975 [Beijerinckiaceae bacterium]|nr:hypothetical protein [Beijerinckiaceae bacterium]